MPYEILTDEDVAQHLTMSVAIRKMEDAFREMANGTLESPPRFSVPANEGALVMAKNITRTDTAMITLFNRHIRWHLSSNGARQWFEQFQEERGFPEDLTNSIRKAIS